MRRAEKEELTEKKRPKGEMKDEMEGRRDRRENEGLREFVRD